MDARGRAPDPDLGPIEDGSTLDLSGVGGLVNVRAEVAASAQDVGSVRLDLRGPYSNSRTENAGGPYALFGGEDGDYFERALFDGSYTLTATPYGGRNAGGGALPPLTVAFTVTGGRAADASPVTGFTLVDARGGAPDPDLGPITDGATVDVSGIGGEAGIRADVVDPDSVGSMRLGLSGPVSASRMENAPAPFALFGDDGDGDYYPRRLVAGSYRVKAMPYGRRNGDGVLLPVHEVSFVVTNTRVEPAITGFTLIDARDDAAGRELGSVADGGVVDVSRAAGRVDIRADVTGSAGSVRLSLSGPRSLVRVTDAAPFSLFGLDRRGSHRAGWLADGAYTLTATVFAGHEGSGEAVATRTVAFTVSGGVAGNTVFTLVDARGGPPDPDIGPVPDGATLDLSAVGGVASIRADVPAWPPTGSARLTLSGARYERRVVNGGSPYALFGELAAGDYRAARLPNGGYTLTVRPYTGADASGNPCPPRRCGSRSPAPATGTSR